MPSSNDAPDPLRNLLKEAETELSRRLHEACEAEARGVASDSAREIRQLEDSLLSAAMAAEQVIAARRHLRRSAQNTTDAAEAAAGAAESKDAAADPARQAGPVPITSGGGREAGGSAVREFEDETGRSWRAWPVTPDLGRAQEASRRSLGDFQEGWICFEALDNSGRRRLPRHGRRWSDLPAAELPRLLAEAINVPPRKPRRPDDPGAAEPGGVH